jgi:Phage-related tail protein
MKYVGRYDDAITEVLLVTIRNIIGSEIYEVEPVMRVMTALGTSLLVDDRFKGKAMELNVGSWLDGIGGKYGDKASEILDEIKSILQ